MKKDRWTGQPVFAISALLGVAVCMVVSIILISIVTTMILQESLSPEYLKFISPCLHLIALFAGCICAGMIGKKNILYLNIIVFAVIYFLCVGATILVFDGTFEGLFANLAAGLVGAVTALLLCTRRKNKTKMKFRKPKIC